MLIIFKTFRIQINSLKKILSLGLCLVCLTTDCAENKSGGALTALLFYQIANPVSVCSVTTSNGNLTGAQSYGLLTASSTAQALKQTTVISGTTTYYLSVVTATLPKDKQLEITGISSAPSLYQGACPFDLATATSVSGFSYSSVTRSASYTNTGVSTTLSFLFLTTSSLEGAIATIK